MTEHWICDLDTIPNPGSRAFSLQSDGGPVEYMLVRKGDSVFAYRNSCPHTGAPLDWMPGQFLDPDADLIQCAMHGALFLIETGECIRGPCAGAYLDPRPITIADGHIFVSTAT